MPTATDATGELQPGLYRVLVRRKGTRHWKKVTRARVRRSGALDFLPYLTHARVPKDGQLEFALSAIPTKRHRMAENRNDRRLRRVNASIRARKALEKARAGQSRSTRRRTGIIAAAVAAIRGAGR